MFATGETTDEFQEALKKLCENPIGLHRGIHLCEYCRGECGNGQICIQDANGIWYAAPKMIYHYVTAHNYKPPDQFIESVLNPAQIAEEIPK